MSAKNIVRVIGLLLIVAVVLHITGVLTELNKGIRDFLFPDKVITDHKQIIVTGLQGMGQLVTAKHTVKKPDLKVEIHRGVLNYGYYSANHMAIGVAEAGIDFDAIGESNVRFSEGVYTLTLPAPVITSCRIEHIDQSEKSFTLLDADWDLIRQFAQAEAMGQFAVEMIKLGLLEKAAKEAKIRIGDFVTSLTERNATIEFAERGDAIELPDSCKPYEPSGWEKTDGGWKRVE